MTRWRRRSGEEQQYSLEEAQRRIDLYWSGGLDDARQLLDYAQGARDSGGKKGQKIFDEVLAFTAAEHLREIDVRRNQRRTVVGLSFRSHMTGQYQFDKAVSEAGGHSPGVVLTMKSWGTRFSSSLGLPTAQLLAQGVELGSLVAMPDTVIKPAVGCGSKGVFLVLAENDIYEVRSMTHHSSMAEVAARALSLGVGQFHGWNIECLLTDSEGNSPPNDLKFYTFYGEVGLVLEVCRRERETYCWYDRTGEVVETGKYLDKAFIGNGLPEGTVELVERVSLEIPSPFMRIDTLSTADGLLFGEYTARPGNYERFDIRTDRMLGMLLNAAQGRLFVDLMGGKEFHAYQEIGELWLAETSG